jgi:hypothetical protein
MMKFLFSMLGVPLSTEDRATVFAEMAGNRSKESAVEFFRDGASHNTAKSGALLGAQGIFVVVDIFAIDHGWPKNMILASLLLMLAGSLLVMTNLRGTLRPYRGKRPQIDAVRAVYNLVLRRSLRFNVALYLTFLSIVLLALAAITFIH